MFYKIKCFFTDTAKYSWKELVYNWLIIFWCLVTLAAVLVAAILLPMHHGGLWIYDSDGNIYGISKNGEAVLSFVVLAFLGDCFFLFMKLRLMKKRKEYEKRKKSLGKHVPYKGYIPWDNNKNNGASWKDRFFDGTGKGGTFN